MESILKTDAEMAKSTAAGWRLPAVILFLLIAALIVVGGFINRIL